LRLLGQPPFVVLSDPDDAREVLTAPPDLLHPGEGARILEPVVGTHSVILLDEAPHLEQRKLMLPAFHGERMQRLSGLMSEVAGREAERWPRGEPVALHPQLQALTLEIILRAVFGIEPGPRLDAMRTLLTAILELGSRPEAMIPALQREIGPRRLPWNRFFTLRDEIDRIVFELIDERRAAADADGEAKLGDDVLAMLLEARHEDDSSPMSPQEIRDELMTSLVAGHETTASQLGWTFEAISRHPDVLRRLEAEVADGEEETYLTATIQEALRRRPVLPNPEPRKTTREATIGGHTYPAGVALIVSAYLIHHDPAIYPEPYAFRPERFVDEQPGTYTWLPFGGGRRRCLGASFAMLEMRTVVREVLRRHRLVATSERPEPTRRRSITLSPGRGARVVLAPV
jgi:cytochrome P450